MARRNPPDNPYLAARNEWNERYGSYVKAASAWRIVGITGMAMAVIGFSYALYQSTQVKLVPYIVEVDRLGNIANSGVPQQIEYTDPRIIRTAVRTFVSELRSVTPDAGVQKRYLDNVYAHLRVTDPALQKINAMYRGASPFDRARTMSVSVEVTSFIALSERTYQIDWTEYERDRQGKELALRRYRGIATVTMMPPQDDRIADRNPLGIYLTDFEWTAQL